MTEGVEVKDPALAQDVSDGEKDSSRKESS